MEKYLKIPGNTFTSFQLILTGNPGRPGLPSGPCKIKKLTSLQTHIAESPQKVRIFHVLCHL